MSKSVFLWSILSAVLLVLAGVLSFPGAFGLVRTAEVAGIGGGEGFALSSEMPKNLARERGRDILFRDAPVLCENGIPLARPDSPDKEIANAGRGRYRISGSKIHLSTSDGGPQSDRIYTVRAPLWSVREGLLLFVWFLALFSSAIVLRIANPGGTTSLLKKSGAFPASLALVAVFAAGLFLFPSQLSDRFFLGLLLPAIWAALMAVLAMQTRTGARAAFAALALLPAFAGAFYYGLNAASDSSFLVAGVIPFSDARIHFLQAAEIAIQGTTEQMFNGRFLYPAFYSVLLQLSGLNVLVANLLVSSLVMLGLAITCPLVARRLGFSGTAIYCFLYWLYFRAHGCGLLMTENLGLLLGVVGFGFLLLSVDQRKPWPVFASIIFFGLGSAARPGAMFILPALALYAGIRVWTAHMGRWRMAAATGAVLLGLAAIAGCLGANQLVMKSLSRGETKAFENFAFTLHGLLNDTKWSTSAEQFGWDTSLVMEHNIRQIKEAPESLIRGIGRAYGESLRKGFLFRFGEEKRLAHAGMALFALASLGCWFWKPLRADSAWILLSFFAILASIPFAPPWDAGERPYAVTEPVQIFLAAAGVAMLLDLLSRLTFLPVPSGNPPEHSAPAYAPVWLAAVCFLLVLPAPLLIRLSGYRSPVPQESPALFPGSRIQIAGDAPTRTGTISRARYLDRLSDFQACRPEESRFFLPESSDFLIAIDWTSLEPVVLPQGVQKKSP